MDFNAGPYQPPPVSDDRSDSPPPGLSFDANIIPLTGLELIVRGLDRSSSTSAHAQLTRIIDQLRQDGQLLPSLHIVSPSSRENLDYVFISLTGNLRENPRPNVLDKVHVILDTVDGIQACWKMMKGIDKTRQVYFVPDDRSQMSQIREKLDNIFRSHHYDIQSSWLSTQTGRITYNFVNPSHVDSVLRTYPSVDGQLLEPKRPRFIPITYGLEVAVNNVGDYPQARSMIDGYIEHKYATTGDPVVRWSRLCLNDNVYCAVLKNPAITNRFLSEPFELFNNSPSPPSKPDFLFNLNTLGIPTTTSFRQNQSQESPYTRQQLDNLQSQNTSLSQTLNNVCTNQSNLVRELNNTQTQFTQLVSNMFAMTSVNSQLMMAHNELNGITLAMSTANIMRTMTTTDSQHQTLEQHVSELTERERVSRTSLQTLSQETAALRSHLLPTIPPTMNITQNSDTTPSMSNNPTPTAQPLPLQPTTSALEPDDDMEANEVYIATRMHEDEVCSPKHLLMTSTTSNHCHAFHAVNSCVEAGNQEVAEALDLITCTSSSKPIIYPPLYATSISPYVLVLLFSFLCLIQVASAATPLPFRTLAINANGLSDPMKIAAINNVISKAKPHAFVIGETKSAFNVGSRLRIRGYTIYENPGRSTGNRNTAKWGVLVGIQQGLFNVQNVPLPETIAGRAIALDLTIPTNNGRSFQHRLVGVYAPWNPGIPDDDSPSFWPTITETCNSAQFSWSIIGDINATLSMTETTTQPYRITPARLAYNQFLTSTDGIDLWTAQPQHNINSQFTYRPYNQSGSLWKANV
jgi:hypothetical protein